MDVQTVENHIVEYAQHRRALYLSFIRRKMRMDQETAESLFHEALLRCWKNRHDVRGDNFAAYFRGVVRNVMMTHHHRVTTKQKEQPWDFSGHQQQEEDTNQSSISNQALASQLLASLTDEERRIMIRWAQSEKGISSISSRAFHIRAKLRARFACHAT